MATGKTVLPGQVAALLDFVQYGSPPCSGCTSSGSLDFRSLLAAGLGALCIYILDIGCSLGLCFLICREKVAFFVKDAN